MEMLRHLCYHFVAYCPVIQLTVHSHLLLIFAEKLKRIDGFAYCIISGFYNSVLHALIHAI